MYFTRDTVVSGIEQTTDGALSTDDDTFEFDTAPTARVRNEPWTDAFDTEEFFVFDTVAARPIEQTYYLHGDEYTFEKTAEELRRAAWSVDNVPYPLTHPDSGPVKDTSDVHGFLREPRYVEDRDEYGDALVAKLYVPTTDDEARDFLTDSRSVSIGFYNDLDWSVDANGVDARQTNILVDHVAGVEQGRCSIEDGCGIQSDSTDELLSPDGTYADAVAPQSSTQTERTSTEADPWRAGQWVKWTDSGRRHHGRLLSVEGERALVKFYDAESGSLSDWPTTVPTTELQSWVGPMADSCGGETCSCGCHTSRESSSDGQQPTHDAPDGIYTDDDSWYGIAPSETSDDEPKYELNDCNDVKDAFNLRNNGDYSVETSTLVARIKRAADAHDCSDETRPWTDSTSDDSSRQTDNFSTNMTEETESEDSPSIDTDSLVAGMSLDAIAESNDKVARLREDKGDLESKVDVLEDKVESLEDEKETLEADLEDYREAEKDELVDAITDLTSAWEADALREESVEELERRKTIAEDAATSPSTPSEDEPTDDDPTTDGASDDDGYTVAMEHRGWG